MIVCVLVIVFFATIVTGPAGLEWLEARRLLADRPRAHIAYLPSAACRAQTKTPPSDTLASGVSEARYGGE